METTLTAISLIVLTQLATHIFYLIRTRHERKIEERNAAYIQYIGVINIIIFEELMGQLIKAGGNGILSEGLKLGNEMGDYEVDSADFAAVAVYFINEKKIRLNNFGISALDREVDKIVVSMEATAQRKLIPDQITKMPREAILNYMNYMDRLNDLTIKINDISEFLKGEIKIKPIDIYGCWSSLQSLCHFANLLSADLRKFGRISPKEADEIYKKQRDFLNIEQENFSRHKDSIKLAEDKLEPVFALIANVIEAANTVPSSPDALRIVEKAAAEAMETPSAET